MNHKLKKLALVTALGISLASVKAQVASPDIFLGFRASTGTGASVSLTIDLGTAASIASAGSFTLDLSSTNSILSSTFGTNWASTNTLYWGVLGGGDGITTVDAWIARQTGTVAGAIDASGLSTINSGYQALITAQYQQGGNTYGTVTNSQLTVLQYGKTTTSVTGNWVTGVQSGWNYFGSADYLISQGLTTAYYTADYSDTQAGYAPVDAFTITQNLGVITVAAVPEPSTYALAGLGALALLVVLRRQQSSGAKVAV